MSYPKIRFPGGVARGVAFLCLVLSAASARALPDSLSLVATNPWTHLQATFNLSRYNLRGTNYQVRVYSDATSYILLPTNQIPEVTTYRGRIAEDPGAVVTGAFGPDGKFYYTVSYGCRWQANTSEYDPYDTTNRLSWGGGNNYLQTANLPSLGYVTNYSVVPTNLPQHINWSSANYPAAPALSYGGPPYLNVLKQVPVQRARLVLDSSFVDLYSSSLVGSSVNAAILLQECRINNVDYEQARDLGICYQIECVCVRTNTQAPYTTTDGNLSEEQSLWSADPGYSHGVAANGWFDMVHGAVTPYNSGASGLAYVPGDFSVMQPDWGGFASGHEMGHNWGQGHYTSTHDYTGDNFWHVAMDGSGFGYSTLDANTAQNLRRNNAKGGIEWVKYNYPLPPHATPDLATTRINQAVGLNVLLNDYIANSNTLSIVSFETNTVNGGSVTSLGNGVLQYTPRSGFVGYDLFHYYVGEPGGLKSLTAAKVLVTSDANPLLGEWTFNDTNGTSASELTGNGQAATLYGTANFSSGSVPGVGGSRALHFDGAGYARFQGTWFDAYNTNLSLSLWVKPDTTPGGEEMLFMKGSLDANNSPGLRLGMNATSFFFTGCTVGGQTQFSATASVAPQAGVWYHLVGEIDRTSGLIRLYVNGVEYTGTSNTRTIPAGEFVAADNWPVLGMANDGNGNKSWFTGALDDLRLYTKVLSAAEVVALYQGSGLLPAGGPHPYDGEINVAFQPAMLWQPGNTNSFQYNVYLGTNAANVAAATTNSAEFQGQVASASFTPASPLAANANYYWRVDEVFGTNVVSGPVWSFTTAIDALHGGLKLYLSLDARDTVGATTYDRAGAPFHDGTLYNSPAPTVGEVYEGLAFNGTSSYVETPPLQFATSNLTMLAWINSAGAQSASGVVFMRGNVVVGLNFRGTTGQLGYHWNDDPGSYNFVSNLSPPANQWSLAALTVQNNRAILYLGTTNGALQSATNNFAHVVQSLASPMDVGRDSLGGRIFNGAMDEIVIWNRTLSASEIGQILTNGINGASFGGPRPVPNPATFTWTGNNDAYWTNALNWAANGIPGSANTVYFNDAASGNTGTQLGANLSVAGVNLSGGLRGVGIAGTNTLTVGAGGIALTNAVANLTLGAAVSLGAAQTWWVSEDSTLTLTNKLSGSGNPRLTLDGGGMVYLNNNTSGSSYGGLVLVNAGTLSLPNGWGNPSLTGNVSIGTNATLIFNTHPYSYGTDNYTTNAGTILVPGGGHLANLELRGGQIIGNGSLRVGDYSGTSSGGHWASRASSVTATINVSGLSLYTANTTFTVEKGTANPDLVVSAPISDGVNGKSSFTKTGAGSLTLTQPSLYTGSTTNSQGTINLSGRDNILPVTTGLYLAPGTTLNLNPINQSLASLSGSGAVNLGSGSLTITTAATNTFAGLIAGAANGDTPTDSQTAPPGGLAMAGTGRWTLSSAQAYSGDTWISSGTLALSGGGALAGSTNLVVSAGAVLDVTARGDRSLNLGAGQTLQGFGAVLGNVNIAAGATVAPGQADPGTLTTGAQTWNGGGAYAWQISDALNGSGQDLLNITSTLNLQATTANPFVFKILSLTPGFAPGPLAGFNNQSNYQWTVAATTSGIQNFNPAAFAIDTTGFSNALSGGVFSLAQSGNALVLNFTSAASLSPTPASVTNAAILPGGAFAVSGSGAPGQSYVLQATTNLVAPVNWVRLLTNQADGNGVLQFLDTQATNWPARFYRVSSP
jgi:autotransporter-associated beta strand protein